LFGTISGVVSDPTGAVAIGATVTVTHIDTNVAKTLTPHFHFDLDSRIFGWASSSISIGV